MTITDWVLTGFGAVVLLYCFWAIFRTVKRVPRIVDFNSQEDIFLRKETPSKKARTKRV